MGFFDRLAGKPASSTPSDGTGTPSALEPSVSGVAPRLIAAREKLDAKDLKGALVIYEEVLATGGDRADVLVAISGDLGSTGHIPQIIELVAPRYDATRHGPAAGINLIQAYLAVRDADAARHVLDILFALQKPELEDRLHGFSNAIAELINHGDVTAIPEFMPPGGEGGATQPVGVAVVTISKPIWAYGLESFGDILPKKEGKMRRVAFTQLALPGAYADVGAAMREPEDEIGRMSCALPLWFAETFYFSPLYSSIAAFGCMHDADGSRRPTIFTVDWTIDNLKKLVETTSDGLDYIFTGSLKREGEETVLQIKVWEVKKFRERKEITARWTAATADAELKKLHEYIRRSWNGPLSRGCGDPLLGPVLADRVARGHRHIARPFPGREESPAEGPIASAFPVFDSFAPHTFSPPASSLAWIPLRSRAKSLGLAPSLAEVMLSSHPAVARARTLISS